MLMLLAGTPLADGSNTVIMINIFQTDEMEVKNPLFNDDPTPKLQ